MEITNSAKTMGTEECVDGGGDTILCPCPEVGSVNGRVHGMPDTDSDSDPEIICTSAGPNGRVPEMPDWKEQIMETLRDPKIHMIGVIGIDDCMGPLFDTIIRRVKRDDLFGVTVMVTIGDKPDLTRIQQEIAHQLGFSYQQQEKRTLSSWFFPSRYKKAVITENAKQLSHRIQDQPKILFILRDLYTALDLTKLGIPIGVDQNGCKLILTSEDEEILSKMNVQLICGD